MKETRWAGPIILIGLLVYSIFPLTASWASEPEPMLLDVLWRTPLLDQDLAPIDAFGADAGDVDGDGIADVAVVPTDGAPLRVPADETTFQIVKSDGTHLWSATVQLNWGRIALKDIDLDGKCEVFLHGHTVDGGYGAIVYAFDDDGTFLWEFHGTVDYWGAVIYLSFLNLDDDAELEVIASTTGWGRRTNYAIDGDGSELWHFTTDGYMGYPIISDVTNDGEEEIILASFRSIYVLAKDGGVIWQRPPPFPSYSGYNPYVASGDITGDGINDVVLTYSSYDGFSYFNTLHVYRNDGTLLWEKSYPKNKLGRITNPILIDLDDDGVKEVVLYGDRRISAYTGIGGSLLWTFGNSTFFTDPVVLQHYDINHDSAEEIVFQRGSMLYALSNSGEAVASYQLPEQGRLLGAVRTSRYDGPEAIYYVMGDVDDDGFDEIIIQEKIEGVFYVSAVSSRPPDTEPPMITIVTPVSHRVYPAAADETFDFYAADNQDPEPEISATLTDSEDNVFPVIPGDPLPSKSGLYVLAVTATDDAGNLATETVEFIVYDPAAGFVTGGGWLIPEPGLGENATFSFVAKYLKGSTLPHGNLVFHYNHSEIKLKSIDLEWLTITEDTAIFQGTATINGVGLYTFRVQVKDNGEPGAGVDEFNIKIWAGTDTEAGPIHETKNLIDGGNIKVHKK